MYSIAEYSLMTSTCIELKKKSTSSVCPCL